MEKTLVVLAAGMGSRYGGLKQLDPVGPSGETIIDYSLYDAVRAGFTKVIFIIRRDMETTFRENIGNRYIRYLDVEYVFQELSDLPSGYTVPEDRVKPWGTGHALLSARNVISSPFLLINADDYYGKESFIKAAAHLDNFCSNEIQAALVGFQLNNTLSEHGTVSRGVCETDSNNFLVSIEEILGIQNTHEGVKSDNNIELNLSNIVSMNMWLFNTSIFRVAGDYFIRFLDKNIHEPKSEFYIPQIVNSLIQEENVHIKVLETGSEWFGITYQEDKPSVISKISELINQEHYPYKLWEEK